PHTTLIQHTHPRHTPRSLRALPPPTIDRATARPRPTAPTTRPRRLLAEPIAEGSLDLAHSLWFFAPRFAALLGGLQRNIGAVAGGFCGCRLRGYPRGTRRDGLPSFGWRRTEGAERRAERGAGCGKNAPEWSHDAGPEQHRCGDDVGDVQH